MTKLFLASAFFSENLFTKINIHGCCKIPTRMFATSQEPLWRRDPRFTASKTFGKDKHYRFDLRPEAKKAWWHLTPTTDPSSFVIDCLLIFILIYTVSLLPPGENIMSRRRRIIRSKLLKEYGMTEGDLDEIEGYEAPLSVDIHSQLEDVDLDSQNDM
eukprot:Filipodium_phascolosomae@DN41_c0_g1_i1.p1